MRTTIVRWPARGSTPRIARDGTSTFSARETVNLVGAVVNPYSLIMSSVSLTNNLIWDMKPADLLALNEKKLRAMGASDDQASAMLRNPAYSISVLTSFVNGLERLAPATGRAEVIGLALTAVNEDQAHFLMSSVQMRAHHHEWVGPPSMVMARGTVVGRTVRGGLVVVAPVDDVSWTERVAHFARRPDFMASTLDIWLAGRMSPRASSCGCRFSVSSRSRGAFGCARRTVPKLSHRHRDGDGERQNGDGHRDEHLPPPRGEPRRST